MDMNKKGPVIVIEDDLDDQEVLTEIFKELELWQEIIKQWKRADLCASWSQYTPASLESMIYR